MQKKLHKQKYLQSIKQYAMEFQITKEGFEITKLGFYTLSINLREPIHIKIDSQQHYTLH